MCVVLYGLPASNSSRCEQSLVDDFINYNNRDIRSLDASSNSGISQVPYEPSSQIAEDSIAHENNISRWNFKLSADVNDRPIDRVHF
uniref:Uncharacterized protein n=1 Tax=Parascaris univalens TaxID=6257 RepID=A0A915BTH3_PARUN